MVPRYEEADIASIWKNTSKLQLWQRSQLMLIRARAVLSLIAAAIYTRILSILQRRPIDIDWWLARDQAIHHDLRAFLDERSRHLPPDLQDEWGKDITSYDVEESAFVTMLRRSVRIVEKQAELLLAELKRLALEHRYTIMNGRTHGQEGDLQTFGKRCLNWYQDIRHAFLMLRQAKRWLSYSKMSGAVGNNPRITPELEIELEQIDNWNEQLKAIFEKFANRDRWEACFLPSTLLANEAMIFQEVFGV